MNKNKKKLLGITMLLSLGIVTTLAVGVGNNYISNIKATNDYTITLNEDVAKTLTSTSGTFDVNTSNNNEITFSYNDVDNTNNKFNISKDGYIKNDDAITSLVGIVAVFTGVDTLNVYGHVNNSDLLISKLTSGVTSDLDVKYYQYLTIKNECDDTVILSSITYTYECNSTDNSDEASDITNREIIQISVTSADIDTDMYLPGYNSNKSLKCGAITGNKDVYLSLCRTYTGSEFKQRTVNISFNNKNNSKDTWLNIVPSKDNLAYTTYKYVKTDTVSAGDTSWYSFSLSFSSLTLPDDSEVNAIRIRFAQLNGYCSIDGLRISY